MEGVKWVNLDKRMAEISEDEQSGGDNMGKYADPAEVTPATFDASTPVVVPAIQGSASAGEIRGKTKITGGTRMGSWSADKMELVCLFYAYKNANYNVQIRGVTVDES